MKRFGIILALIGATSMTTSALAINEDTLGYEISGKLYGNTSNPSGNGSGVLPSLAPGPWKCIYDGVGGPCVGQTYGGSVGEFISPVRSGGKSKSDFGGGGTESNLCSDNPTPKPGTETGC